MTDSEHAVIIHFTYGSSDLTPLFALEDKLQSLLEDSAVGEYDGNDIAADTSDGYLYMYGSSANDVYDVIKATLEETDFMAGATVKLRYGPPEDGVEEMIYKIGL